MSRRPMGRTIWAAALAVAALAAGLPAQGRDDLTPRRLVAVGDVHGNHEGLLGILEHTGVADGSGRWIGQATTLVQVGDVLDRGVKVPEVLDLLMSLEAQAHSRGGRSIALLGNHEAMNLVGELRDVAPALFERFADGQSEARREAAFEAHRALAARQRPRFQTPPPAYREPDRDAWMAAHPPGYLEYREALGPGGRYGRWLRSRPAVVKVGDTILVHGGIPPDLAPQKLEDINRQVSREIERFDTIVKSLVTHGLALPFFTFQELFDVARAHVGAARGGDGASSPLERPLGAVDLALMTDLLRAGSWHLLNPSSPLWFRGYALWKSSEEAVGLQAMLDRYGASRIVVGHTMPDTLRITPRFSRRVFLIDTGLLSSYYAGGRASALEVRGSDVRAVYQDGFVAFADAPGSPGR